MKNGKEYLGILRHEVDFVIPGFEKSYPKGTFKCLSFSNRPSDEWFLSFIDGVEDSIGKRFLPIYRMGDGEFQVCVGFRYRYRKEGEPAWHYILGLRRATLLHYGTKITRKKFIPRAGDWVSGNYLPKELESLRSKLQHQIRLIAKKGFLSLKFSHRRDVVFTQQYFEPMSKWLESSGVQLNGKNYIPVYFVYAMLSGPLRYRIYKGRRLLVVTSYDNAKRDAIADGLEREGVANTQFLPISQGRSMYDTIDLSAVKQPVDLVLVGGGIGASNILCQLGALKTVAIDAGYIIECLADAECKKERTFCWPDEERNGDYRPI